MSQNQDSSYYTYAHNLQRPQTAYGNYLAGRVAHLRQDLNTAADYYTKAVKLGADEPEIIGRSYLLLTSEGRIHEAAQYAQIALDKGDKSNLIRFIIMSENLKQNRYEQARQVLDSIKDKVYKASVSPLFESWLYAGEGNKKQALECLDIIKKDKSLLSLYYMHNGMINDYFDDQEAAQKAYDTVVANENLELSFRSLQIISNFYLRHGRQDQAIELIKKYYDKNPQAQMLKDLYTQTKNAPKSVKKLIDTPQKGEAEAIFNIGTVFRGYQSDISQILTALALYLNPRHDVARISMADLLEANRRLNAAVEQYSQIDMSSPVYYMAQLKIANDYLASGQFQNALTHLQRLRREYPSDYHILFNLGEVYRVMNEQDKAIDYYQKAIDLSAPADKSQWTVYYAFGIAYERNNQWDKAEKALVKALDDSGRHPFVLNYLGYTWLKHNENSNEALFMIFDAYRQNPEDGHIMDSLGWAYFRMGKYDEAIKVLEKAAEYLPGNAIVCDHLGDAYWQVGRKAEARYQWQHALTLKEDAEELDKDLIRDKLAGNGVQYAPLNYNEALLLERLKTISFDE